MTFFGIKKAYKIENRYLVGFLAEREGLWPNFCSILILFICASYCE